MTFRDVRAMMWRAESDPADWRCKSRHAVLGFWREMKINMFYQDHSACSESE